MIFLWFQICFGSLKKHWHDIFFEKLNFQLRISLVNAGKDAVIIAQKMKFSVKDFFSKSEQIRSFQRIFSNLPKKSLVENVISGAVYVRPKCISLTNSRTYRTHTKNSSIWELSFISKELKLNAYKWTGHC